MSGALARGGAYVLSAFALAAGGLVYALSGKTPRLSYHSMRRLYGPTDGAINRAALNFARWRHPAQAQAIPEGFLGAWSEAQVAEFAQRVRRDGYALLPAPVPANLVAELREFAQRTPCRGMGKKDKAVYVADSADALRYDFSEADILSCPAALKLAFDGTLATLAGAYFGCRPLYDFAAMWWTTRFGEKKYSEAAQAYHFDMDRFNFLKFFVYLSDVGPENGPHVYVAGSHLDKPRALRDPVRFEDAQVEAAYPAERIVSICAPAGTLFAVDTAGLHKGMPVVSGDRLAFQIEFTTGRFGQNYPPAQPDPVALAAAGVGQGVAALMAGRGHAGARA